jgi:mRNA-degrading endonuclease RelE of RelBE toxin-antitoxin system
MDCYKVIYSHTFDKSFDRISKNDKQIAERILKIIGEISNNPYNSDMLSPPLKGARKRRVGKYRIIFEIVSATPPEIHFLDVGKRENIYKK